MKAAGSRLHAQQSVKPRRRDHEPSHHDQYASGTPWGDDTATITELKLSASVAETGVASADPHKGSGALRITNTAKPALRDDNAAMWCPVCQGGFAPSGRRRYCSDSCRRRAWARRHRQAPARQE